MTDGIMDDPFSVVVRDHRDVGCNITLAILRQRLRAVRDATTNDEALRACPAERALAQVRRYP
jgi:hypothetical protein